LCRVSQYDYQPRHGSADGLFEGGAPPSDVHSESPGFRESRTIVTDDPSTTGAVSRSSAAFGHRENYSTTPSGTCDLRLRLTPSQPFKRGAVWRQQEDSVVRGFSTEFTWQIGEHSRDCVTVKDAAFDGNLYSSCAVRGADGFAWVLHSDPNRTSALGAGGGGVGYAGLRWAVAVEFDTSYNPDLGDGAPRDHVQVQARGPDPVTSDDASRLGAAAYVDIADGRVHRARIAYFPRVREDWVSRFTAAPPATRFLVDQGEGRRMGTLALWIDAPSILNVSGAADMPLPTMAVPINLGAALRASTGTAVQGFTSATGRAFERHDILSWLFCEQPDCERARAASAARERAEARGDGGRGSDVVENAKRSGLDYHRESNV